MLFFLKYLGSNTWEGEGSDYSIMVFDSIKDNPQFSDHILGIHHADGLPWTLLWFSEYILSVWSLPIFGGLLAKMVDFLCEELQHERFQESRSTTMIAAVNASSLVYIVFA